MSSTPRNAPCPCGSGEKYKRCCLPKGGPKATRSWRTASILAAVAIVAGLAVAFLFEGRAGALVGVVGLACVGLYLWLASPPPRGSGGDPGAIRFGS